jgi:hypothetical protein
VLGFEGTATHDIPLLVFAAMAFLHVDILVVIVIIQAHAIVFG